MFASMLRILLGFIIACIVAGAIMVGFVQGDEMMTDDAVKLSDAAELSLLVGTHQAIFAAPFALVAAAIGEWQSIRNWAYYGLAGIAIAAAGFIAQYASEEGGDLSILNQYGLTAFLVAGFLGGLAYWLVAGRLSGDAPRHAASAGARPVAPQAAKTQPSGSGTATAGAKK
jgi:hypothetical protein